MVAPSFPSTHKTRPRLICLRVSRKAKVAASSSPDPSLAFKSVTAFAPATVANLGPGFDFLGCAIADASLSLGDTVTATLDPSLPPGTVSIASATSPSRPHLAIAALRALDVRSHAVSIHLTKGLPLDSGLGSSAASTAKAVDALFGSRLHHDDLVLTGLESEKAVSDFHADNICQRWLGRRRSPANLHVGEDGRSVLLDACRASHNAAWAVQQRCSAASARGSNSTLYVLRGAYGRYLGASDVRCCPLSCSCRRAHRRRLLLPPEAALLPVWF